MKKVLVKIYGDKDWTPLTFGSRTINVFEDAIDIANITRFRCKLKLVDDENNIIRKWNNL
jgi:hypothetical protein